MPTQNCGSRLVQLSIVVIVLGVLTSCLPAPLGDPSKSRVDPALKGCWINEDGDDAIMAIVAPFDEHVYCVDVITLKRHDGAWALQNSRAHRAWLTDVKGHSFITLEPVLHMVDPALTDSDATYMVARVKASGETIAFEMVAAPKDTAVASPEQFAKALGEKMDAMVTEAKTFRKLKPDAAKDKAFFDALD